MSERVLLYCECYPLFNLFKYIKSVVLFYLTEIRMSFFRNGVHTKQRLNTYKLLFSQQRTSLNDIFPKYMYDKIILQIKSLF